MQAPLLYRALLRITSWIVPVRSRAHWRDKQITDLDNWWFLMEHGELLPRAGHLLPQMQSGRLAEIIVQTVRGK